VGLPARQTRGFGLDEGVDRSDPDRSLGQVLGDGEIGKLAGGHLEESFGRPLSPTIEAVTLTGKGVGEAQLSAPHSRHTQTDGKVAERYVVFE